MQAILAHLFGRPDQEFYLREIARSTGTTPSSLQRDLAALAHAGIIERTVRGHQVYFRANRACPVFDELRGLVVKTFGVADVLTDALRPLSARIDAAFIYGSVARGEERTESDIDLFVIGSISSGEVIEALAKAERRLGREINPTVFPRAEFAEKARARNHFLTTLLGERKLFLIGGENELASLARQRRAAGAQAVQKGNHRPVRARRSNFG
ncbi:MAG: nucleotidyltransferase domain-containing protein [Burkholderiales bacterium]